MSYYWAIPEKKSKQGGEGWRHGLSSGIEERACGISRGQLKRGGISRGVQEKRLPRRILNAAGLAKPSVEADTKVISMRLP